jgi:hypothetical protein
MSQANTRSLLKNGLIGLLGAASLVYLFNPTAGVFEFLPDNLPVVGNVDEATATAILLASLAHFGLDLRGWLERFGLRPKSERKPVDAVTHERT